MTAEITILNKNAVAMAADSASTVRKEQSKKIFTSANKIFTLSKYAPVGIMVYGSGSLMNVPWETIIKMYRKKLGDKKFEKLGEYAEHFIEYLSGNTNLFPKEEQRRYVKETIYSYYMNVIVEDIISEVDDVFEKNGEIEEQNTKQIVDSIIQKHYDIWQKADSIVKNFDEESENLIDKYSDLIKGVKQKVFNKIPVSNKSYKLLDNISASLFLKFALSRGNISGVVITGFGEKDVFPAMNSYQIEGVANGILKYRLDQENKIDTENSAVIAPFAQKEMVGTFIEGVNPEYQKNLQDLFISTVKNIPEIIFEQIDSIEREKYQECENKIKSEIEEVLKDKLNTMDEYRKKNYVDPILNVVNFLPKDELAQMAEDLVNLTCLKKKVSMEDETVGGPIDVAVISKGDGLIWIKRKHYFEQDLNYHFFENYFNNKGKNKNNKRNNNE